VTVPPRSDKDAPIQDQTEQDHGDSRKQMEDVRVLTGLDWLFRALPHDECRAKTTYTPAPPMQQVAVSPLHRLDRHQSCQSEHEVHEVLQD
jgi:hypothetical protein